ncbi:MAG TPA: TonB-dependent receptor [Sunxiuqinia sp.]|nr:TonB-dependent receptor [Sunxiuqinia sp.]
MRRFIFIAGFLILSGGSLFAQKSSLSDTILLKEVATYAPYKKYQAGAKVEAIPSDQLQLTPEGGLDNILMQFTPIYVKTDAGGLSTIRLRGTAPDHTSVNFGGINVNSLTLGHTNMSTVPSYLFDGVDLQYGSSSAVNGSGSIGGAIYLGLNSNWTNGLKLKATISEGSFGQQLYGAKLFAGNGKLESVTRLFYFNKKNDFPFKNPYTGDVENPGAVDDRQHGASIENMGLIQELNYRFQKDEFIKSAIWLEHDWHQIQPNMQTNLRFKTPEILDNKHIRFWSEYQNDKHQLNYHLGVGYVHDMQVYDSISVQKIATDRLVSELEVQQDFNSNLGYKIGVKYKYMVPDVYAYSDSVIDFEQHLDAYFSAFYSLWHHLKLTLNLRQSYVTNFSVPCTPSLGAEYRLLTNDVSVLKLTSNIARSYRVPTFNDRYWGTQGNPNLKPEDGMSYELGANYVFCQGDFQSEIKLNAFYMNVKNWIEWRDFGVWQAQNLMEVVSKGIEFQSNSSWRVGETNINFRLNYNYNPAEAVENASETGVTHRQLMYVPKQMGNAFLMLNYQQWKIYADGVYTGSRFSDEFGHELDPYFLANCGLVRQISIGTQPFNLSFSVNNLLNTDYQNQRYYAMPGRSFRLSVSTNLNLN